MDECIIVGFVLFLVGAQVCFPFSDNVDNFITWDDMKVGDSYRGHHRLSSRDDRDHDHESRVIVVDINGGGDSITVQKAVDMVFDFGTQRVKIHILPGIYREKVVVPRSKPYISFVGDRSRIEETVITWNSKASDRDEHGTKLGTYNTASVTVESDYFCATGITFENTITAEPGESEMQAVALRISGDRAMFYKVRILGSQDTLLDEMGTHYFYKSYIQGNIDFIFGNGKSLFRKCVIHSIAKSCGAIAAHQRNSLDEDTGFSFANCVVNGTGKILLGRAWGDYSTVVYSNCYIDDIIDPIGWGDMKDPKKHRKVVFGEYGCRGPGSNTTGRVTWSKNLDYQEIRPFLTTEFIDAEQWLKL